MIEPIILSWNYDTHLSDAIEIFEEALEKLGINKIVLVDDTTYAIMVSPAILAPISQDAADKLYAKWLKEN